MASKEKRDRIIKMVKEIFKEKIDRMNNEEFLLLLKKLKMHEDHRKTFTEAEND